MTDLRPSSAARWLACPGSVCLCHGIPSTSSEYASEGTYAHLVAACLLSGIPVPTSDNGYDRESVIEAVEPYVDYVKSLPGTLLVEQRLPIDGITGEAGASGTADAIVISGTELTVIDLKFGVGVKVDAVENPQIAIYTGAALRAYDYAGDFKTVRSVIVQPRLDHVSEWMQSVEALDAFLSTVRAGAEKALAQRDVAPAGLELCPGKKQCQFCPAAARCAAYAAFAAASAKVDLPKPAMPLMGNDELAESLKRVDAVEQWCRRVREESLDVLMRGEELPGFKLVAGREGVRKWTSDIAVDDLLKRMHVPVDQRYVKKVISPAQAQKLIKSDVISERQWKKLEALIKRSEPKPAVVPESDKRPAWVRTTESDLPLIESQPE